MPLTFKETNLNKSTVSVVFYKNAYIVWDKYFPMFNEPFKRVKQKTFSPPTEKIVKQNRTHSTFTYKLTLNKILNI